jgi:hypothetical protein
LEPVAESAVSRSGGRGALGPINSGAKVLIVVTDDQNRTVLELIKDAMLKAGAASVDSLTWSQLGLPTGDFSAADGWRELSDEHVEAVIRVGERVEQDALPSTWRATRSTPPSTRGTPAKATTRWRSAPSSRPTGCTAATRTWSRATTTTRRRCSGCWSAS